ncbi:unnamed protein product, partial [Ilex paraguariensis]
LSGDQPRVWLNIPIAKEDVERITAKVILDVASTEVYVMNKLYKEKMKRMETEKAQKEAYACARERKSVTSDGCFSMMFKKIHPASMPSLDSAGEAAK